MHVLLLTLNVQYIEFGHEILLGFILLLENLPQLVDFLFVEGRKGFIFLLQQHYFALEGSD